MWKRNNSTPVEGSMKHVFCFGIVILTFNRLNLFILSYLHVSAFVHANSIPVDYKDQIFLFYSENVNSIILSNCYSDSLE